MTTSPQTGAHSGTVTGRKKKQLLRGGFDQPFIILVLLLLMFGLVMMFSASYAYSYYHNKQDSFFYIRKQGGWAALGVVVMYIMACFDYHKLHKFVWPLMGVTYALLGVVLVMPKFKGVRRWLVIGHTAVGQPSEIAKFAVVLLFAHLIALYSANNAQKMKTFRYGVLPFIIVLGSIAGLMVLEPHLSGTILILLIGFMLMFIGGTSLKWFIGGGCAAIATLLVIGVKFVSYAETRLRMWLNPFSDPTDKGWQTIQSLYAIGSGGVMGLGLGNSRQKYLYIAEPQNDFVFSIVCEELGLIGAVIVIVLFMLLVWRGFVIAMRAPDKFGALLAVGLTTQVGLQAALNIAVVTNSVPNTGISLPFFSYGGSSLLMLLFEMGIILSVSRFSHLETG